MSSNRLRDSRSYLEEIDKFDLLEKNTELSEQNEQLSALNAELEKRYEEILASASWRALAPLRFVIERLRRIGRPTKIGKPVGAAKSKPVGAAKSESSSRKKRRNQSHRKAARAVVARMRLGLVQRATEDLEILAADETKPIKRRIAAEALAIASLDTGSYEGAKKAARYLEFACDDGLDEKTQQRLCILKAEALNRLGNKKDARRILLERMETRHRDIFLALANLEDDIECKIDWINEGLGDAGFSHVECRSGRVLAPYYKLSATSSSPASIKDGPLVSIIMPAFNAEQYISTAIESILTQTWDNFELIVTDDCSDDGTIELVERYAEKDPRVRLIRSQVNSGPYVARNWALREAVGEFVTCNDSDDWSHPEKIATQVRHLIVSPHVIANTSNQARSYEDLTFYRRGNPGFYTQINMSSLMFRRKEILERVGLWDSVRFGGDSEYLRRIKRVFGVSAFVELDAFPLSFQLQSAESLTACSMFGYHGFKMGARAEYDASSKLFHAEGGKFIDFPLSERPFPIPKPMDPAYTSAASPRRNFDVILISDFRLPGGTSSSNAEEIKAQRNGGLSTGLVQMDIYDINPDRGMNPKIRKLIDGDQVQALVYGEKVSCDLLILRHPWCLENWHEHIPDIEAKNLRVIVNQPPQRDYGPAPQKIYNLNTCIDNAQRHFGQRGIWHPIGPLVRQALIEHHSGELDVPVLSDADWPNIIDVDEWRRSARPSRGTQIRIGRHARDHAMKWPGNKTDLLYSYPDSEKYEVFIMGGAEIARKLIGEIPDNWTVLDFNELTPRDYLSRLDVFVYFTHEHWVEAFGRVIIEAMAVGVPVVLPPAYEPLFGDAALYTTPDGVLELVNKLMQDDSLYQHRVELAAEYVKNRFGHKIHLDRVTKARSDPAGA